MAEKLHNTGVLLRPLNVDQLLFDPERSQQLRAQRWTRILIFALKPLVQGDLALLVRKVLDAEDKESHSTARSHNNAPNIQ